MTRHDIFPAGASVPGDSATPAITTPGPQQAAPTPGEFVARHVGPRAADMTVMLNQLGYPSLDALIDAAVPAPIRSAAPLDLPHARSEAEVLGELRRLAHKNVLKRSMLGQGYYGTHTPAVIRRNVLESPAWYTAYTPYQPEIAQGRLEALLNFQQMITDLTGLDIANASLLDEGTAVAEAIALMWRASRAKTGYVLVDADLFGSSLAVAQTRAQAIGLPLVVADLSGGLGAAQEFARHVLAHPGAGRVAPGRGASDRIEVPDAGGSSSELPLVGIVVQQCGASGAVRDWRGLIAEAKQAGALVTIAADPLALCLLVAPGEWGADIAVGSAQRFGVPLFYGGPHAAFMAVRSGLERSLPGRLVGVSVDADGDVAYRLALQTREQHIRREKATSNICTAQSLLAIVASMYAVYHGPAGLRAIAERVHSRAVAVAAGLRTLGVTVEHETFFDTVRANVPGRAFAVREAACAAGINVYVPDADHVQIACDETTTATDVTTLLAAFGTVLAAESGRLFDAATRWAVREELGVGAPEASRVAEDAIADVANPGMREPEAVREERSASTTERSDGEHEPSGTVAGGGEGAAGGGERGTVAGGGGELPSWALRTTTYLTHPVFHTYQSETAMLRYLRRLADKDLALDRSMIPLGSCTMKLNATVEMEAISWPHFADMHPFAPADQTRGYTELIDGLERALAEITGYAAVSVQPNAGSQGEFAGLLAIRNYHLSRGEVGRDVCLIPASAHGTNAASAAMAGLRVVVVATADDGAIDLADLDAKLAQHGPSVAAIMITYPSTHGVYEADVRRVCDAVHAVGGQVYIDGANLNALVGLARPGEFGGDVSHLNLHKTFCIPHGGGGPGVGPVAVAEHLVPFLPGDPAAWSLPDAAGSPSGAGTGGPVAGLRAPAPVVSSSRYGSAGILPITWAYIALMGPDGLTEATKTAVLAANYVAARLTDYFPVLFTGPGGLVAHECILDLRPITAATGVTAEDVAKRLMDYGFHAPTLSFPVAGTLMVEPTESEDLAELDRFIDAMIAIAAEIQQVADGLPVADSALRGAPHTAACVAADTWDRPYTRGQAAYPVPELKAAKYWPPVRRIDGARGDRNLVCTCPPLTAYQGEPS